MNIRLDLSDDEIQAQPTANFMQELSYDMEEDDGNLNDLQIDLNTEKART